jgi:CheY-like chemotaxis protein
MNRPVLVVDDEPDTRTMLATMLEFAGFAVATAANGREALDAERREEPCVILLDLMMPVMDGEQFCRLHRQDPQLRQIPVVVLSARHDAAVVAARLGADDFAPKPIDFDRVIAMVSSRCQ